MGKEAVFTMKLEPELRSAFMAATASEDRPASQVVRELMRTYIEQRQKARDYGDYLHAKVEVARQSVRSGKGIANDVVEAEFATKRSRKNGHK